MSTRRQVIASLIAAAVVGPSVRVFAGEGLLRCRLCSSCDGCQKVCRLVCEDKKITTTCWGTKCEDFCAPGPSCPDHEHCEMVCGNSGDPKAPCSQPKPFRWIHWTPGDCGTVYTKKKLMKKTVTKTVPSFKWVVEDLCPACQTRCAQLQVPAGTELPPVPKLEGVPVLTVPVSAAAQVESRLGR